MIKEVLQTLAQRKDLSSRQTEKAVREIMANKTSSAQMAAFLVALKMKGECVEEIIGGVQGVMSKAVHVATKRQGLTDLCGTGGDGQSTFNVSTLSSFVAAGAGVNVAKHGNRSVSSRCGSADILEALGVDLTLPPATVGKGIDEIGYGFLFAPNFHPAMKYTLQTRREIGLRTLFNIIGPLANPMRVKRQLLGVYSFDLLSPVAEALRLKGVEKALVVHSEDGLDEISACAPTRGLLVTKNCLEEIEFAPEDFCIKHGHLKDIKAVSLKDNIAVFHKVLKGEKGPERDIVVLNSGAAIFIAGIAGDIQEGIARAFDSIDSGRALQVFDQFRSFSKGEKNGSIFR